MKVAVVLLLCVAAASAEMRSINKFMMPSGIERFQNVLRAYEHSRIVGGTEAKPHSRPFQVGLLLTLPQGTAFCGGSLISKDYVLTAAHCVWDGRNNVTAFTVVLGAHNIYDEAGSVRIQTKDATMHPAWNPLVLQNDLALIKLPVSVELNDKIQTIELPPGSSIGSSFLGVEATVSGWGKANDSVNALAENLREVTMKVMTNIECNVRYLGVIKNTHLCTSGKGGKSSCNGDSGGPLTAEIQGKIHQIGVVSFGIAFGCEKGWPAVFTRLTNFVDWVHVNAGINRSY